MHTVEALSNDGAGTVVPLSEDGFQRVAKLKNDVEMKAFINRVLQSEARYATDKAQINGFVPFYSGTKAHAAHKGAHKCDIGESVSEELCLQAAQQVLPEGQTQGRDTLQVGSYARVPVGCSVQSGGDWAAHYNKNPNGMNDGGYSPICAEAQTRDLATMKAELRRANWVADGLGRTAQLTEEGYQKVVQLKSTGSTRAFLRRLLEADHSKVTDDKAFDGVVRIYSGEMAAQKSLAELQQVLKSAPWVVPLGDWQGLSGSTAPLTEEGYQLVAKLKNDDEMKSFIHRLLESEARTVQDEAGLNGVVPYHSGTKSVQTLDGLKAEIRDKERNSWVGKDIGRTAELSEEGYASVAERRSNVQMKEFIRRFVIAEFRTIDAATLNGLVPYHSGKISVQSFDKLKQDIDQLKQEPVVAVDTPDAPAEDEQP